MVYIRHSYLVWLSIRSTSLPMNLKSGICEREKLFKNPLSYRFIFHWENSLIIFKWQVGLNNKSLQLFVIHQQDNVDQVVPISQCWLRASRGITRWGWEQPLAYRDDNGFSMWQPLQQNVFSTGAAGGVKYLRKSFISYDIFHFSKFWKYDRIQKSLVNKDIYFLMNMTS